jgi:hypothetical protein
MDYYKSKLKNLVIDETELIPVTIDGSITPDMLPKSVTLNVNYHQVDKEHKKIIFATLAFETFVELT